MKSVTTQNKKTAVYLEQLSHFFMAFPGREANDGLHRMMRAAFSRRKLLSKEEVLRLLFLKDELHKLIPAAAGLAKESAYRQRLAKYFSDWPAGQWLKMLDQLFYAALYDSFNVQPAAPDDVYHYCRGLHALVRTCCDICATFEKI